MCGPHNSTLWASDFKFLVEQNLFKDPGIDLSPYQLSDDDIVKLTNHIESIEGNIFLELKGGEPLIMPQTKLLIDKLVKLKNSKKITLLIVTNGTVIPEWITEVNEKFNKLQLVVSIDGIGSVFDYIRGTEKFSYEDCLRNIRYYHSLENIDLRFNVVVQNLNIHQMLDVHQVLDEFNTTVNYITLSMPKFLEVNVMPKKSREMIYLKFLDDCEKFGNYKDTMQNIHNILLNDPNPEVYGLFKNITLALDERRNQDLKKVASHLLE
jgi:sulfatase maturation enzyme AslB (radical SAM superfamily)